MKKTTFPKTLLASFSRRKSRPFRVFGAALTILFLSNLPQAWTAEPDPINDLTATAWTEPNANGQIRLQWTSPAFILTGSNPEYDVRYSTVATILNGDDFADATALPNEPTPAGESQTETMTLTGLTPGVTYYFAIRGKNDDGDPLDTTATEPKAIAPIFWIQQEPLGAMAGFNEDKSCLALGDFDGDGDLDLAGSGQTQAGTTRFLIFRNDQGVSPFTLLQEPLTTGLKECSLAFSDVDNDGDLDLGLVGSRGGSGNRFYIFENKGGAEPFSVLQEPYGTDQGLDSAALAFGDFNNDGKMDLAVSGNDGETKKFLIYKNVGGTAPFELLQEPLGPNAGLNRGALQFGDFDNDGDLDLVATGIDDNNRRFFLLTNEGGSTPFSESHQFLGSSSAGLAPSALAAGDFDNDGDLDLAAAGQDGSSRRFMIFQNEGPGTTFTTLQEPLGSSEGLDFEPSLTFGDFDSDGDLDLMAAGRNTMPRLYLYENQGGSGPFHLKENPMGSGQGFRFAALAMGDIDLDGDLDVIAAGRGTNDSEGLSPRLIFFASEWNSITSNTPPTAPTGFGFSSENSFDTTQTTVTVKWSAGTYDTGMSADSLYFHLALSASPMTLSGDNKRITSPSNFIVSPANGSPLLGNYLRPPKIVWPGDTTAQHGIRFNLGTLQAGVTYYWRVQTIDSGLARSQWSSEQTIFVSTLPVSKGDDSNTFISSDGKISLEVPQGTFPGTFSIALNTAPASSAIASPKIPTQISNANTTLAAHREDNPLFPVADTTIEIVAFNSSQEDIGSNAQANMTLTFSYNEENGNVQGTTTEIRPKTLAVYHLNERFNLWVKVPTSQVDTDNKTITATIPHLSVYSVIGALDTSLTQAFAFPVPFQPSKGHSTISFVNLAQVANVQIYTVGGQLVRRLEETDGDGVLDWDVKNSDGQDVASGVYFYLIESSSDKKHGKLVVIR